MTKRGKDTKAPLSPKKPLFGRLTKEQALRKWTARLKLYRAIFDKAHGPGHSTK